VPVFGPHPAAGRSCRCRVSNRGHRHLHGVEHPTHQPRTLLSLSGVGVREWGRPSGRRSVNDRLPGSCRPASVSSCTV
jgi:hypothetical protein